MKQIVNLGGETYVLASEIVAVTSRVDLESYYLVAPWKAPVPYCTVVLCDGSLLAGYVSYKTMLKRWKAAIGDSEVPTTVGNDDAGD